VFELLSDKPAKRATRIPFKIAAKISGKENSDTIERADYSTDHQGD
jgi:hypothetical protein